MTLLDARRVSRGGAIGVAGAAVNGVLGFVLTTVLTRVYGVDGAGVLFTVIGLVTIAGAVCCLGADTALMWAMPRLQPVDNPVEPSISSATVTPTQCRGGGGGSRAKIKNRPDRERGMLVATALIPSISVAVLVAIAGVALAEPLARALDLPDPTLLRMAFGGVPLIVAATVLMAAVRATRPVTAYVAVQFVLVPLLRPALLVAAGGSLLLGFGAWLAPLTAALVIGAVLAPRPKKPKAWRVFWGYALPRAASVAVDASSMWVGVLLTGALSGPAEAGLFAAAGRYALAGLLIMQGLRVAMAPHLSRLLGGRGAGQRHEAATLYRKTTQAIVALSFPAYLLLAVFAPAFLGLFGGDFPRAAGPLAVLAGAMLVNVGVGLAQTVLLMSGNSRGHLYATLTGLAANVAAALLLVPRYGAMGAALAWSLGIVAENVIAAALARRALREPLSSRPLWLTAAGVTAVTGLAAAAGVVAGGRGLGGLATALALLLPVVLVAAVLRGRR
ncbi:polysaccharide biosynthesis C-terminal domain-containing protein [Actinoplanes sp. NPDC051470]|uniref:lipopolysaccharide biosynthesis protein n=1 Tax=Actinoplanes sp. NPDC051470 TaxID=3157224 RepID=UPI00343083E9